MNTIHSDVTVAALVGFIIGMGLMIIIYYSSRKRHSDDVENPVQKEYDAYRERVNQHFAKTADAIDDLTKSYQQVFAHLSDGAEHLMDKQALQEQLEKRQGKAVTLAYLVEQEDDTDHEQDKTGHTRAVTAQSIIDSEQPQQPAHIPDTAETTTHPAAQKATVSNASSHTTVNTAKAASGDTPADKTASAHQAPQSEQPSQPVNVHIAAEKAGLKFGERDTRLEKEHETAIDAIKKHIKEADNKAGKA